MNLLFDQNLPPRLADALDEFFPGSCRVHGLGLGRPSDRGVWEFARENDSCIVSKDSDFRQLRFLYGGPPKTIWIRRGNCTVGEIEQILREGVALMEEFEADGEAALLILS